MLVMAKFAMDCLAVMDLVTEKLVVVLGPDTNALKLRVGLHSGPVVAGVLRGDKSRFQLFGDAMNTASRMESTGVPSRFQVSQETADLLIREGKKSWLTQRKDPVTAKGKGELVTYFVQRSSRNRTASISNLNDVSDAGRLSDDTVDVTAVHRNTHWTVEVLSGLLKEIAKFRGTPSISRLRKGY